MVAHDRVSLTTAITRTRDVAPSALIGRGQRPTVASVEVFESRRELLNPKNSHTSPTPVVDDERYTSLWLGRTAA